MSLMENTRWVEWCKKVEAIVADPMKRRPMSDRESSAMVALLLGDPSKEAQLEAGLAEVFQYKVTDSRLKSLGVNADIRLKAFLSFACGTTGVIVMFCHYIAYRANGTPATLDQFCHWFPMGFPTEEAWSELWVAQKTDKRQNYLDSVAA